MSGRGKGGKPSDSKAEKGEASSQDPGDQVPKKEEEEEVEVLTPDEKLLRTLKLRGYIEEAKGRLEEILDEYTEKMPTGPYDNHKQRFIDDVGEVRAVLDNMFEKL